jgi:hypothetical protein
MSNKNIINVIVVVLMIIIGLGIITIIQNNNALNELIEHEKQLCIKTQTEDMYIYKCNDIKKVGLFKVKYEVTMVDPLWDIYMLVKEEEFKNSFKEVICGTDFPKYGADVEMIVNGSIEEELFRINVKSEDCE